MPEADNILSGIRVIDCGTYIAAPAAAVVMSAVALCIPPLAVIIANAGPGNRQ